MSRNGEKRTRHHRRPRSAGGNSKKGNISNVRQVDHVAFHRLFGPGLPHVIAEIINEIWIDPEFELVVRKRKTPLKENTTFRPTRRVPAQKRT